MTNTNAILKPISKPNPPFETWYEETYGKWVCDDNEQLVYVKASQHPDDIAAGQREYNRKFGILIFNISGSFGSNTSSRGKTITKI